MLDFLYKPVALIKPDGSTYKTKADIQAKKIFVKDTTLPVEIDDIIVRDRGNGIIDRLVITDVTVYEGSSLAHIELLYRNEKKSSVNSPVNIGSISGERIYINSSDNSTNTYNISSNLNSKFEELKEVISRIENIDQSVLKLVDEMKENIGKPSFKDKYAQFIANMANHITVITPFIPFLTDFL